MAKRNLYLDTKPVEEAAELYLNALRPVVTIQYETIPVTESLNRVTRHATYAK